MDNADMNIYYVITPVNIEAQLACYERANLEIHETTNVIRKDKTVVITSCGSGEILKDDKSLNIEFECTMEIDLKTFDKAARDFIKHKSYDLLGVANDSVEIKFYTSLQKHLIDINADDFIHGYYIHFTK